MDATLLLRRYEALAGCRAPWEGLWAKCAEYALPGGAESGRVFDSTAPVAASRFASALESLLAPRGRRWHGLTTGSEALDAQPGVAAWLEDARDLLFALRLAPAAGFANQMSMAFLSLAVFGTAVVYVDDDPGRGFRYSCVPVREVCLAEDGAGAVDTVFRAYRLTARQAAEEFGDALPEAVKSDAADPARADAPHEFIHAVLPRPGAGGAAFASYHLARDARQVVREGFYRTMPYAVSRFSVAPGEVYGRGPAMDVLPDILQVNAMMRTIIRAAEKAVNPPLLVPEGDALAGVNLKAGALNYGGVSLEGKQLIMPLESGNNIPLGLDLVERERAIINEGFYLNLFQSLAETPQKTATEVIERSQEKAQLLSPVMGRQQSELLRVIIERELDILAASGAFLALAPPAELAGRPLLPRYESDVALALAGADGLATLRAVEGLAGLARYCPGAMNLIDGEAALRSVWRGFGANPKLLRDGGEL